MTTILLNSGLKKVEEQFAERTTEAVFLSFVAKS